MPVEVLARSTHKDDDAMAKTTNDGERQRDT